MKRLILSLFLLLVVCTPAWAITGPVYIDSYSKYWQTAPIQHWPDMKASQEEVDRLNNLAYFSLEETEWGVQLVRQYPYKSGIYGYFYPECCYIFSHRSQYNVAKVIDHELGHLLDQQFNQQEKAVFLRLIGYEGKSDAYSKSEAVANAFPKLFGSTPDQRPYSHYLAYWLCVTKEDPNLSHLPERKRGDVNNDGKITATDIELAQKMTSIKRVGNAETFGQYWSADMDRNNFIDKKDMVAIEKEVSKGEKKLKPWLFWFRR